MYLLEPEFYSMSTRCEPKKFHGPIRPFKNVCFGLVFFEPIFFWLCLAWSGYFESTFWLGSIRNLFQHSARKSNWVFFCQIFTDLFLRKNLEDLSETDNSTRRFHYCITHQLFYLLFWFQYSERKFWVGRN